MGSSSILPKPLFPIFSFTKYNKSFLLSSSSPPNKSNSSSRYIPLNCFRNNDSNYENNEDWVSSESASPYQILGVDPTSPCSSSQLKAAFRSRVKEFHPDVCRDKVDADATIQRVFKAYEILSKRHENEDNNGVCLDPFEEPECEAYDLFIDELLCIGRGCQYSCVKRAPFAFSFTTENGTARATCQGRGDDYQVQTAVSQCPKRCIHYVTPSQRAVLEELLVGVLTNPYDSGEAAFLEYLIIKATSMNNRYQMKPKRQADVSSEYVDWC